MTAGVLNVIQNKMISRRSSLPQPGHKWHHLQPFLTQAITHELAWSTLNSQIKYEAEVTFLPVLPLTDKSADNTVQIINPGSHPTKIFLKTYLLHWQCWKYGI